MLVKEYIVVYFDRKQIPGLSGIISTHAHVVQNTHTQEANGTTRKTLTPGSAVADRRKMRRNSPNSQVFYL